MDAHPIAFSTLALVLCIHVSKLYRWYKEELSDFSDQKASGDLHAHDLSRPSGTVQVPIMKPDHIGEHMAIDEKHIDGEFYTVLTNKATRKVAMLAQTVRHSDIAEILSSCRDRRYKVKGLTRDLSNSYDWVGRTCFPNAMQVADKFHIIKEALDQLQNHRIGFRQALLTQRRQGQQAHKEAGEKGAFRYKEGTLENGDTHLQLLARGRYLLYQFPTQWSDTQKQRAGVLFKHYPSIKQAYELICRFRRWYRKCFIKDPKELIRQRLNRWYERIEKADIVELSNFKAMIERHQGVIINYFVEGHTNAIAEATNKKINTFIRNNQGVRDKDFFFFRIKNYFC